MAQDELEELRQKRIQEMKKENERLDIITTILTPEGFIVLTKQLR